MKQFKSKPGILYFVWIILVIIIGVSLYYRHYISIIILSLLLAFTIHLFISTVYTVTLHDLVIRSSFYKKIIPISEIRKISYTRDPISSPAPSLQRLEIKSRDNTRILISPSDKELFISEIVKLNNTIEIIRLKSHS